MTKPKIEVTALVVRYPDSSTRVSQIRDSDEDAQVLYPPEAMTLEQLTEAAIRFCDNDEQFGRAIRQYLNGQHVALDGPAGALPSIGGVLVSIETKILNWE